MPPQISNIYTLGQVEVSSQPLAQLEGKLLAQQQAKQEALNKFFEGQMKDLSRKGIADNDVEDFNKKLGEVKNYWFQNKGDISRGGAARREFDDKIEDLKSFIYESTGKKEEMAIIDKLRLEGKINDEDIHLIDKVGAPISRKDLRTKPDGTKYSLSDFSAYVPLPDINEQNSYWNLITEGVQPKSKDYEKDAKGNVIYKSAGPGSFEKIAKYKEKYNDNQILEMSERAALFTSKNKKFRKLYSTMLNEAKNAISNNLPPSDEFTKLANAYSKFFPADEMDTPEELARAAAIAQLQAYSKEGEDKIRDRAGQISYGKKFSSGGAGATGGGGGIDLSEYPEVAGKGRDITDLMQGVSVFSTPDGKKFNATKVYYDPSSRKVTFSSLVGRDAAGNVVTDAGEKQLSLNTFLQNIKTLNPGTDFKFVEKLSSTPAPKKTGSKKTGAGGL